MLKYALKRLLIFIPMLIVISLITFIINLAAPGDPVQRLMQSADTEGSVGSKSQARQLELQEKRRELGLDRPVFYLGINSLAHPDTLHLVQDLSQKKALGKLVKKYGNWNAISDYYHSLKELENANGVINVQQIYAASSDTVFVDTTYEVDGETVSETMPVVKSPYNLEAINEAVNRANVEIVATLQSWDDEIITSKLDTIKAIYQSYDFMADALVKYNEVVVKYDEVKNTSSKWKTYIPKFSWNGTRNQYHLWLLGNVPPFSSKAKRRSKLQNERNEYLGLLESNKSYALDPAALDGQISSVEGLRDSMKKANYYFQNKADIGFGKLSGFYSYLSNKRAFEENELNQKIETYAIAYTSNPETPEKFRNELRKHNRKLRSLEEKVNYARYGILRGDFGWSLNDGQPIKGKILSAFPWSFSLAMISIILAYLISIPIGIYSAYRANGLFDRVSAVFLYILYSAPSFWVATILLYLFANSDILYWFPESGVKDAEIFDSSWSIFKKVAHYIPYLILPIIAYTYSSFAFLSRLMRSGMMEVVNQDYIRTARAKGLSERKVVMKHAMRNSLLPIITVFASIFPAAIGGSVILEYIFSIPGMGTEIINAVRNTDYSMIMAVFSLFAVLTMVGLLVSDLLYSVADPRISLD